MEEKTIIEGEHYNFKGLCIAILTVGAAISIIVSALSIRPLDMPFQSAVKVDGLFLTLLKLVMGYLPLFIVLFSLFATFGVVLMVVPNCYKIVVTDKRVFGTVYSKNIDLPVDSISSVSTGYLGTIRVSTASGIIVFQFLKNADDLYKEISKLIVERQNIKTAEPQKQETNLSSADELKKFKELFDSGVITEEEFAEKKKQLLGL